MASASTVMARGWARDAATGGLVAGLVGAVELALFRLGLATALYWIVAYVVGARRLYPARYARSLIWSAVKLPAYPFVGERALDPGFDAPVVLLGVVDHLALSMFWGVLFGLVAHGLSCRATLAAGVLWGVLMWWVCYFVVLPLLGARELARSAGIIIEFIPYGLAMAGGFVLWQRLQRRRRGSAPVAPGFAPRRWSPAH